MSHGAHGGKGPHDKGGGGGHPPEGGHNNNDEDADAPPTKAVIRQSIDIQAEVKRKLEARLPGGKKTKRLPVLKLELGTGDAHSQVGIVAKSVYGFSEEMVPTKASLEYTKWRKIDESIYGQAKESYDGISDPFLKKPRVYKLESVKEKVWEGSRDRSKELADAAEAEYQLKQAQLAARKKMLDDKKKKLMDKGAIPTFGKSTTESAGAKAKGDEPPEEVLVLPPVVPLSNEEQLQTFLDPFEPPAPWFKEVWKNKLTYVNADTKERVYNRPGVEIWEQKLAMLERLTPRDDLDGYEYKEDDAERRKRLRQQMEFDRNMQEEIRRRTEEPNDIEQIEDVLFDMIDTIAKREEKIVKQQHAREKKAWKATWHLICQGYKMKALPAIENAEGQLEVPVTDLEFVDMIISQTGHMLSLQTPPGFFQGHKRERDETQAILDEAQAIIDMERNRPMKEKARILLALARNDPRAAAKQFASGVKNKALAPYRKLKSITRKQLIEASQRMAVQGLASLLKVSRDPAAALLAVKNTVQSAYMKAFPKDEESGEFDALMAQFNNGKTKQEEKEEKRIRDEELKRVEAKEKLQAWKDSQARPVKHVDTVQVTMTFLVEVPPPYVKRQPRTYKDDLLEAQALMNEKKAELKEKLYPHIPPLVDSLNEKLAFLGLDAMNIDEEYYYNGGGDGKKKKPRMPWQRIPIPPPKPKSQDDEDTMLAELGNSCLGLLPEEMREKVERQVQKMAAYMPSSSGGGGGEQRTVERKEEEARSTPLMLSPRVLIE